MQVTHQERCFLSWLKIEINYAPVESGFERRLCRFVKAQKFSEQISIILERLHAVKQIEFPFQTLVMPKCLLFQPGQDNIDSIAVIETATAIFMPANIVTKPIAFLDQGMQIRQA